jgi:hypothetical protein
VFIAKERGNVSKRSLFCFLSTNAAFDAVEHVGIRDMFFSNSSIREDSIMWAIVKKPELSAVSVHDPGTDTRTDSERFRDFAKENGIDENDPTWVRIINALEALEKLQAGTMTEYLEIAFIEFELEAAFKAFDQAHRGK